MAGVRRAGGRIHLRLNHAERMALLDIVESLAPEVAALPVGPAAYEDAELEAEFERLVRPDLARGREADIQAVTGSLRSGEDSCSLTDAGAFAWIRALNHLRLAAAARLGLDSDGSLDAMADSATRERREFRAIVALAYIQEELVAALQG